jgi:uncharacterized protein (TIGR02246 family)
MAVVGTGALAVALGLTVGGCGTAESSAASSQASAADAVKSQTQPVNNKTVAALFDEWNAAVATGDPEKVADRYASDAVLLPTVSNKVRTNRAEIVDYFVEFLKKKPSAKILKSHISVLDENSAVDTGTYAFAVTENGQQKDVIARYTYVYELRDGKWLIVNHHSSMMPEG